jgi:hypothetical protein
LGQLSVTKVKDGALEFIVERDPRRIYDRLVAWFVRHDSPVPLSSDEFLSGIRSRFPERDGMVFLPDPGGGLRQEASPGCPGAADGAVRQ